MAYHLDRRRPLSQQLVRLVRDELKDAAAALGQSPVGEEEIHRARTCLKKSRAVVRILRYPLKRDFKRADLPLRVASHALAELRDADVMLETLEQLQLEFPGLIDRTVASGLKRGLQSRRRVAGSHTGTALKRARGALHHAIRSVPAILERKATRREFLRGVESSYQKARRAGRDLAEDAGPADFHRWRRRLKDHWYHMRLLEQFHPTPRDRAGTLNRVEGFLGDDHNLAMLRQLILAEPDRYGNNRAVTLTLGCIARKQHGLRSDALAAGQPLFERKRREFGRSLKRWCAQRDSG